LENKKLEVTVAKKAEIKKKKIVEETQAEKPSVVFLDESANKSTSLITLGLIQSSHEQFSLNRLITLL
jgi:hypothetical protein